jgi:hypothetical protein
MGVWGMGVWGMTRGGVGQRRVAVVEWMAAVWARRLEPRLKPPFIPRSGTIPHSALMTRPAAPSRLCSRLRRWWPPLAWLSLLATLAAPPSARADDDDDHDHDRARAAVAAGEVLPLQALLARLRSRQPGEVLEVELEQDHGRWRYEIKLLQADGTLRKLKLDARTGEPLQRPGHPAERPADRAASAARGAPR